MYCRARLDSGKRVGVVPAAPQAVVGRQVIAKLADGLLTVEKNQLELARKVLLLRQRAGHLDERAGARAAVVGSDETLGVVKLGVVVRAHDGVRVGGDGVGGTGDEVDELDGAVRRGVGEGLPLHRPADRAELRLDVLAGLFERGGPARARAESHQSGHMFERALPGELLAERFRHRRRRAGVAGGDRREGGQQQKAGGGENRAAGHRAELCLGRRRDARTANPGTLPPCRMSSSSPHA